MPVRLRLTLAFAAGMAVLLAVIGAFLYVRLGDELLASIDLGLRSRAQVVSADVADGTFSGGPAGLSDPDEAFAQLLSPSGQIVGSSQEVADAPLVGPADLGSRTPVFVNRSVRGLEDQARLLIVPGPEGRFVVVGATLSDRREALDQLLALFAIGGPVALLLMSLAGWALAGEALRPVDRMREEAAAISATDPDRRLPVPPGDDGLARLATSLNEMLDRLQTALSRERRFVDDASHELRTPLTILKGELDLALSRERSPDDLKGTLRRASAEADRLASLAEDLLVLARSENGRMELRRERVSVARLVEETVDGRRRSASEAGVTVTVDVLDDVARLDPVRVRQALENALDNAIRHTPPGGVVTVSARSEDAVVVLTVRDTGSGFVDGMLIHAFEPFTHDPGRHDGAGLGLAIVRSVAASHGGSAAAENLPSGGAQVTIRLRM